MGIGFDEGGFGLGDEGLLPLFGNFEWREIHDDGGDAVLMDIGGKRLLRISIEHDEGDVEGEKILFLLLRDQ